MATELKADTPAGDGMRRGPRQMALPMPTRVYGQHRRAAVPTRTDALVIDASMRQALIAARALGRSGLRVGAAESPDVCDPRFRVPTFASRWSAWNSALPSY